MDGLEGDRERRKALTQIAAGGGALCHWGKACSGPGGGVVIGGDINLGHVSGGAFHDPSESCQRAVGPLSWEQSGEVGLEREIEESLDHGGLTA